MQRMRRSQEVSTPVGVVLRRLLLCACFSRLGLHGRRCTKQNEGRRDTHRNWGIISVFYSQRLGNISTKMFKGNGRRNKSICRLVSQWGGQEVRSGRQSVSRSFSRQSVYQSASETANQPVSYAGIQSLNQPVLPSVRPSVRPSVSQSVR